MIALAVILRRFRNLPLVLAIAAAAAVPLHAQAARVITLRMLDAKSGQPIAKPDFLVQINHETTQHADWVHAGTDGSQQMTVPADATEILIHGKYDLSMSVYVNCDTQRNRGIPASAMPVSSTAPDKWYSVSDILASGVVAHNGCGKGKDSDKLLPKPGEFVFYVRKMNWREEGMN